MILTNAKWKNKKGTAERFCRCGSWKNHWMNNSGKAWPFCCSVAGCINRADVGAHIINSESREEWIVPMCRDCNQRTDEFVLSIETILVSANKEKTGC